MSSFRKGIKIGVLVLVGALAVSQAIRIDRTNPPVRSDISMDAAVKPLLKRACYNCHSNETVWPWYSRVAPVSWLLGSDVQEARRKLNFSEWDTYAGDIQGHKLKGIAEEMEERGMPPWYYSMVHRDARLSQEERDAIRNWTIAAAGPQSPK
jgi:hypothetical protein